MFQKSKIEKCIEEATVDCYDEDECYTGFHTMMTDNLSFPFTARVVGEKVLVQTVDTTDRGIVAICEKGGREYRVDVLDLHLEPALRGKEWIDAYRSWLGENA